MILATDMSEAEPNRGTLISGWFDVLCLDCISCYQGFSRSSRLFIVIPGRQGRLSMKSLPVEQTGTPMLPGWPAEPCISQYWSRYFEICSCRCQTIVSKQSSVRAISGRQDDMVMKCLSVEKRRMPMPSEWPANHPDRNLFVIVEKYLYPSKCPSDFSK